MSDHEGSSGTGIVERGKKEWSSLLDKGRRVIISPARDSRDEEQRRDGRSKNGINENGFLNILDLYNSPSGLPSTIDLINNRLVYLATGAVLGEGVGIPKAGRSWHFRHVAERLIADRKLREVLGRIPVIVRIKPNILVKNLYKKDLHKRPVYHERICNDHRNALLDLRDMTPLDDVDRIYADVVLFDRGAYDDIFWSHALREYFEEDFPERKMNEALEISRRSVRDKLVDIVFGINVPPDVAMEREGKRGEGHGNVMNPEFLAIIYAFYMKAEREENIRKHLEELKKGRKLTEEDYKDQTRDFLIQNTRYFGINGEDPKEVNADKFFYPLRNQLLYNHGVSEELEHLAVREA